MKKTESIIIKFIFYILSLASLAYVVYNLIFASYVANLLVECITGYIGCDDEKKEIYLLPLQTDYAFSASIPNNSGYLEIKFDGKNNVEINNSSSYKIVRINDKQIEYNLKWLF